MKLSSLSSNQADPDILKPPFSEECLKYKLNRKLANTGNDKKLTVVEFMDLLSTVPPDVEPKSMCTLFRRKPKPAPDPFPEDKNLIRKFIYTLCLHEEFLVNNKLDILEKISFPSDDLIPVKFPWKTFTNSSGNFIFGSFCLATKCNWQYQCVLNELFGWRYEMGEVQHFDEEKLSATGKVFYNRPNGINPIFMRTMETVDSFMIMDVLRKIEAVGLTIKKEMINS